jgi:hypothetical protein
MMLLLRKNTATHPSAEIKEQEGTKHIGKEDEDEDEKEEDEDKDDTGVCCGYEDRIHFGRILEEL